MFVLWQHWLLLKLDHTLEKAMNNLLLIRTPDLMDTDLFLFVYRKSPAGNQPSVTKVCLSGESYHKPSST